MAASSRIERRRAEREARLVQIAAKRFSAVGVEGARLDEIADEADIARATLYTHFPTKEALVAAIVRAPLLIALREIRAVKDVEPREGIRAVIQLYLRLWRSHPEAMCVAHRTQNTPLGDCAKLHAEFLSHILRLFGAAAKAGLLRAEDPKLSSMMLARLAIPLLEMIALHPRADALFLESLEGLLLKPAAPRSRRK